MNHDVTRPNRRPKLFLPAFLAPAAAGAAGKPPRSPFPLSAPELRRVVAEMLD